MDRALIEIILDLCFFAILFLISVKDLKTKEIPNSLTLAVIFLGILKIIFLEENFEKSFLGFAVFPIFFIFIYGYVSDFFKKEVVGFGDIKLMGAAGFYLGYSGIYNFIIFHNIIFILGFIFAFPMLFMKKIKREEEIPFAPCICAGTLIYKFFMEII